MPDARATRITSLEDLRFRNNPRFLNTKQARDARHAAFMAKIRDVIADDLGEISDYAETLYVTQLITQSGGGNGYTLKFEGYFPVIAPSTTYYIGGVLSLGNTVSIDYIYVPKTGTLKAIQHYVVVDGFSSGENTELNVYKNGSLIFGNLASMDLHFAHSEGSANESVKSVLDGVPDELTIEIVTPAWSTIPTNVQIVFFFYIE